MSIFEQDQRVHGARRNGGRRLAVILESGDNAFFDALVAMSFLTKAFLERLGYTLADWPEDPAHLFSDGCSQGRRWTVVDALGDTHTFVLLELDELDVLLGVSSRITKNDDDNRSQNKATNELLDLLSVPEDATSGSLRPHYGEIFAVLSERIWRTLPGASHVIDHCESWDIKITTGDLRYDPMIPHSKREALDAALDSERRASLFKKHASLHRQIAHERGECKYPRTGTYTFVSIDPDTGQYGYDRRACDALRTAVALVRQGGAWDEVAALTASDIPSYMYRALPDRSKRDLRGEVVAGPGSREATNEFRKRFGLPLLPYKLRKDGSANPRYVPETYASGEQPGLALRRLLLAPRSIVDGDLDLKMVLARDLDGQDPRDFVIDLLATGTYNRMVLDQLTSNRDEKRYKVIACDLGPYEEVDGEARFVINEADARFLKAMRNGKAVGRNGSRPLIRMFTPVIVESLWTNLGLVEEVNGQVRRRQPLSTSIQPGRLHFGTGTTSNTDSKLRERAYKFHFALPRKYKSQVLGMARATTLERNVGRTISDALAAAAPRESVEHSSTSPTTVIDVARREMDIAKKEWQTALDRLLEVEAVLSDESTAALASKISLKERAYKAAVENFDRAAAAGDAIEDSFRVDRLLDLCAILQEGETLDPKVARQVQTLLRMYLKDRLIWVDPTAQLLRWTATLELRSRTGAVLRVPLSGSVPNETGDGWLAGAQGVFWRTHYPLHVIHCAFDRDGRFRESVLTRLMHGSAGLRFAGRCAAWSWAKSPYVCVLDIGFALWEGRSTAKWPSDLVDAVKTSFFGRRDIGPNGFSWTLPRRAQHPTLIPLAAAYEQAHPQTSRRPSRNWRRTRRADRAEGLAGGAAA